MTIRTTQKVKHGHFTYKFWNITWIFSNCVRMENLIRSDNSECKKYYDFLQCLCGKVGDNKVWCGIVCYGRGWCGAVMAY